MDSSVTNRPQEIIQSIGLQPHPEGGWFKETYRSSQTVSSPVHGATRSSLTDIHFMLEQGQISRFHRVEHDEIWYWHEGDDLELVLWDALDIGATPRVITLGSLLTKDVISSESSAMTAHKSKSQPKVYKFIVPAGIWQAARPLGEYTLVSCAVAPGFDFEDFRFMEIQESEEFKSLYPEFIDLV
jgi:uncharacterized protein